MNAERRKAVFLDRDGTINIDTGYVYRREDFEYVDGAVEGMCKLTEAGYLLVVVTNQSGIARGYYTEPEFLKLDKWMKADLKGRGVNIVATYYCPHLLGGVIPKYSVDCECRKPKTALFWKAARELGIDLNQSYAVGDKLRDLGICKESGVKGIFLSKNAIKEEGVWVCRNWEEIAKKILDNGKFDVS